MRQARRETTAAAAVAKAGAVVAAALAFFAAAQAAVVQRVTPQGEVPQVRQVTVTFAQAEVPFGDLRLPDPFAVSCRGATAPALKGVGRWANDRTWLYDFAAVLPPGVRCTLKARAEWKPLTGALAGPAEYAFSTGGPAVASVQPGSGDTIEEDQHFLLRLTGPATPPSVEANARCEVEGIGEAIGVRVVGGAAREAVLKSRRVAAVQAANALVLTCRRPLPPEARVKLVWGRGIASAGDPAVVTRIEQRHDYTVRALFKAEFSCERERANAPCLPIRPLTLAFSSPIARDVAAAVRLKPLAGDASSKPYAPAFDKDDQATEVESLKFPVPLAENASYAIELPAGVKDASGRPLANAGAFPLKVATGAAPPIAKFAAAPFGVVELNADAMLPLTLRHVQGDLKPGAPAGAVRVRHYDSDADVLAAYARVSKYHESSMTAEEAGLPRREWTEVVEETDARGRAVKRRVPRQVGTRELSLLKTDAAAKRLDLPQLQGGDPRPFEVIGVPLAQPGYQLVEIESPRLGAALLDKRKPMYVRTGVLLTNLGVHFKQGRENAAVWVTRLDSARPVAGADVAVNDCRGRRLWAGRTDAAGLARIAERLDNDANSDCPADAGFFVTARKAVDAGAVNAVKGATDMAFVFSTWQKGVEPWRFNLPTSQDREPDLRAATVFDRTLLRAGETVSMKHFVRRETSAGVAPLGAAELPGKLKITHQGSGQSFEQELKWSARSAASTWAIPPAARLGVYEVSLEGGDRAGRSRSLSAGSFRVEEFRVPLVDARLAGPKEAVVAPREVPLAVQMNYLSGGGMAREPARVSALLKTTGPPFDADTLGDFSFEPPRDLAKDAAREAAQASGADADEASDDAVQAEGRLVADKVALVTDASGAATLTLKDLPPVVRPSELQAELTFNDPNGEVQTVSSRIALWPSAVVIGIRSRSWASSRGKVRLQAVALDTTGKPIAGQKVEVRARLARVVSTRKRIVGGFYAYDNRAEVKDLGSVCSGSTDGRGVLDCQATLDTGGQVELIAEAKDASGRASQAAASVWITGQGELWFAQDDDDRIDVLPEKRRYEPGETAKLQVRMPFREATALVAVEREGVIATQVATLRGDDPTIELKIDPAWAPNVYVSVLALRGRIREVPWYSFFTWGWKEPLNWVRAFRFEGREYRAPTALVDLAKPAFKLGVASFQVGSAAHRLDVAVSADKPQYAVRQKALARVKVTQGGKPVANTEVAFAAVDEGLLALQPNGSWNLLDALIAKRAWGVETSTGQSEIIGRRHYGRKAVAAGGGGGKGGTRELFDTLLVWKASVALDANGEAVVEVPLNDSLTSFRLVAIADDGAQRFGTGGTSIRVTQDVQALSGLPPLVREGDRFEAMLTVRNTTAREMKLRATLAGTVNAEATPGFATAVRGLAGGSAAPAASAASATARRDAEPAIVRTPLAAAPQDLVLAAGAAKELRWPVEVPAGAFSIAWEAAVEEQGGGAARDRLKVTQLVVPAVPTRVLQATLQQLDGGYSLPVAPPADALPEGAAPKRGGIYVGVQPRLSGALPGLRRFFETYPFACLEQKTSKAVGLNDAALWQAVANALPTYLDRDGLAGYFPPRADDAPGGSDRLTAYVVAATHEAGFALPEEAQKRMLDGLTAFVEGRIERRFWSPRADLDVRKLAALEALSRHGRAQARQLGSINLTPGVWPTAALIDWLNILKRVEGVPDRAKRLEEANQLLRGRLTFAGTTLKFSTEESDFWWWLMDSADANAARLVLAVLDDPAWKDDVPRLVVGALGRQQRGAWLTTTANLWGAVALTKFSARFESQKVAGRTVARLDGSGGSDVAVDWSRSADGGTLRLPWGALAAARPGTLSVSQEGSGRPWLTVQSLAAIPLKAPLAAGYRIARSVSAVEQKTAGTWSRGDVMRVRLEIDAQSDMTWVVASDPVPAGATLLGSGLGRDSQIATRGEKQADYRAIPAFEERGFEAYRSYFALLPKGRHVVEYTLRLNNPGRFSLPPTRVEAMYAPETFGEVPNGAVEVGP